MALRMQSLEYFMVILRASLFACLAMAAMASIHSVGGIVVTGGGGCLHVGDFVYCLEWGVLAKVGHVVLCIWFF